MCALPCSRAALMQVPKWLAVKDMSTSLALELLDAALQCQPAMVKSTPQLLQVCARAAPQPLAPFNLGVQVVQSRVCPVLQSMMLKPPPFPVCIRCLRLVSRCPTPCSTTPAAAGPSPLAPASSCSTA